MGAIQIRPSMAEFNSLVSRVDAIGTVVSQGGTSASKTMAAGTVYNIASVTLAAGVWVVKGWVTYTPNSAAQLMLDISTSPTYRSNSDRYEQKGCAGGIFTVVKVQVLTASVTLYLNLSSSVAGYYSYGGLQAVRIR